LCGLRLLTAGGAGYYPAGAVISYVVEHHPFRRHVARLPGGDALQLWTQAGTAKSGPSGLLLFGHALIPAETRSSHSILQNEPRKYRRSSERIWRRGWESNPRARVYQATRFRGGLFRPLRHLSAGECSSRLSKTATLSNTAATAMFARFPIRRFTGESN
jgi:hypothetical protein